MTKKFSILNVFSRLFGKKRSRIGIYGPPNAGKTTLANRIVHDVTGETLGTTSEVPHETRRAQKKDGINIKTGKGKKLLIDIIDTPGVTTKINSDEFIEYGMDQEEAITRAREATEGVAEAMHWLREDIDGVIYVLDSTQDPFMNVNIMMIGIIESRKLPVVIVANKIDLPDANPRKIRSAFPQHQVIELSGLEGNNMEALYEKIAEVFK